jgi:hypothetical protein
MNRYVTRKSEGRFRLIDIIHASGNRYQSLIMNEKGRTLYSFGSGSDENSRALAMFASLVTEDPTAGEQLTLF